MSHADRLPRWAALLADGTAVHVTAHDVLPKRALPCKRRYPREVPPLPWYRTTVPQMLMAGFLPFSAIYIELYYIFASVWGHKARLCWSCATTFCRAITLFSACRGMCITQELRHPAEHSRLLHKD